MDINNKRQTLTRITNRVFILSPTVSEGKDRECTKNDFIREENETVEMGVFDKIWRVSHKTSKIIYSVKVLSKQNVSKLKVTEQINITLGKMYKVNHINFLRIYNHYEDDENLFLVIQDLNKTKCLNERLKSGDINKQMAINYIRQVIYGLIYLHSIQIYNRDLKSENIYVYDDIVKITDIGWSDMNDKYSSLRHQSFKMNCERSVNSHTPPEVFLNKPITNKVDIWHLGVLFYELLSNGNLPFATSLCYEELKYNIIEGNINWNHIPDDLHSEKILIEAMLKNDPNERISLNEIIQNELFSGKLNYDPKEKFNPNDCILNKASKAPSVIGTRTTEISSDKIFQELKKENENLKKDIEDFKNANTKLKTENDNLKNDNNNLKEKVNSITINNKSLRYSEDLTRDLEEIQIELEEKSQENLEQRSKIRVLENELELLNLNFDEIKEINLDYENEIKKLKIISEQEQIAKDLRIDSLNNKIESLEKKLFNSNTKMSVSGLDGSNEDFYKNFSSMLYDSVKDFNSSVNKLIDTNKDSNDILMKSLHDLINSKESIIRDLLAKNRESLEIEFIRRNQKTSEESSRGSSISKGLSNDKLAWLTKQINELLPYKLKSVNQEENLRKLEKEIKILNEKLNLMEIEIHMQKIKIRETKRHEDNLNDKLTGIENKLSDAKSFVMKYCPEKIEEFFLTFKV